ncbi:MAG: hypothetical protein AB9M53_00405 [Leptothrix sp. (in: b-proteobacteria)]
MSDSNKEVAYEVTGDPAKFVAAMQQAGRAAAGASAEIDAHFKKLSGTFDSVNKAVLGFTAVLAGGGALKKVISDGNEWNLTAGKMASQLGVTTEQASVLNVALKRIGVESDTYLGASQKLSKQIQSNGKAFDVLGVSVRDVTTGAYRPVTDVMTEVNTKLAEIKNPIEQNIAGQQIYGKGWAEVKGILKLTTAQMAESEAKARELGLIVGPDGVAASKQYAAQMRDLGLVGKSLEVQFGNALLPVFVATGSWLSKEGPQAGEIFGTMLKWVTEEVVATYSWLKIIGQGIGGVSAAFMAAASGDFQGARTIWNEMRGDMEQVDKDFTAFKTKLWAPQPKPSGADAPALGGPNYRFKQPKDGADPSQMAGFDEQLAKAREVATERDAIHGLSKQDELTFWRDIQATVALNAADQIAVAKKVAAARTEVLKQQAQEALELGKGAQAAWEQSELAKVDTDQQTARLQLDLGRSTQEQMLQAEIGFEERRKQIKLATLGSDLAALDPSKDKVKVQQINTQIEQLEQQHAQRVAALRGAALKQQAQEADALGRTALDAWQAREMHRIDMEQQDAQQSAAMGQATQAQLLQQEVQFEERRTQIKRTALEAQLAATDPTRNPVQASALNAQLEALEQQHQLRLSQIRGQIAVESSAEQHRIWKGLGDSMSSLWDKGVQAMLNGTLTWKNAMKGIGAEMTAWFVKSVVGDQVKAYLKGEAAKLMAKLAFKAQEKTADVAGAAATVTVKAGEASAVITANAAEAASGAAASQAPIPIVGPGMAAAAFAAVMAMVMGAKAMVPSAAGGFDIPAGVNPLTQLHEREMVLPAKHADVIRSLADGGAGGTGSNGTGSVNVTVRGAGAGDFFMVNRSELVKAIKAARRDGMGLA